MLVPLSNSNAIFLCLDVSTDFIYVEKINKVWVEGKEQYISVFKEIIHPSSSFKENLFSKVLKKSFLKLEEYPNILLGSGPGSFTMLKSIFAYLKTYALLSKIELYVYPSFWLWYHYLEIEEDAVLCIRVNRSTFYLVTSNYRKEVICISKPFSKEELLFAIQIRMFYGKKVKKFYIWNSSFFMNDSNEEAFNSFNKEQNIHLITVNRMKRLKFSFVSLLSKEQLQKWKSSLYTAIPSYGEHVHFVKKYETR